MSEQELISKGRGKWSDASVPKNSWSCIGMEDFGEPKVTCEMCEATSIRYGHRMVHNEYPTEMVVGCVCAGHMEEDSSNAKSREVEFKSRVTRRERWLTRKWRTSEKGNDVIKANDYRITIFKKGAMWNWSIDDLQSFNPPVYSPKSFPDKNTAKLSAFDFLETKKTNIGRL